MEGGGGGGGVSEEISQIDRDEISCIKGSI